MDRTRVLILGAAGRDFHNYNVAYRDNPAYEVVAFTAQQIPNIAGRTYPPALAGSLYPSGIPIYPEDDLEEIIAREKVQEAVLAYSDVSHEYVMHLASRVLAAGPDFSLLGPGRTMLPARVPVIAVCAVRTGAGKSQTTRRVVDILREAGRRVVVVRHPMPYGDLAAQACQRFATYEDLERHEATIEEREEYEPHIERGTVVYAGVDYAQILASAQGEADVVIWDGGNNDLPFYRPDLHIVVADPLRPGHEVAYHPGEANVRMADVVVVNKVDAASPDAIAQVRDNVRRVNPGAMLIEAASPITVGEPEAIQGRRVLVIEDGPTLTHGGMAYGAGVVAARRYGAAEIVDPRPYAVGSIAGVYAQYPHVGPILPAMGYGEEQVRELGATIAATPCDAVLVATPIDLGRLVRAEVPMLRLTYALQEIGRPDLHDALRPILSGA
jgi:predicted GTPase